MPLVVTPPSVKFLVDQTRKSSTQDLDTTLSILFEPSPTLHDKLVPELAERIKASSESDEPKSYENIIQSAIDIVHGWDQSKQAEFVGSHPRIGETQALSALSAQEQGDLGASTPSLESIPNPDLPAPTPQDVLDRLKSLNDAYETLYPGLVYITFVNGRSRAQIRDEMEDKLRGEMDRVAIAGDTLGVSQAHETNSNEWKAEVTRAVNDVGKIAQSRVVALGLE